MMVAERDHDGTCQRGEVDHRLRLEMLLRVPEHVSQDETSFGIGVLDLDGLAGGRGEDVTGADGIAIRHVLDQADEADHIHLRLALGERQHRAGNGGCPPHVTSHVFHARSGLQ